MSHLDKSNRNAVVSETDFALTGWDITMVDWLAKCYKELLLFSLQSRIVNARASEQMTKRNKLDVFFLKMFAINHSYHSSQPKSTCGSNMAPILLYTIRITEHLVFKIATAEQSLSY